MKRILREILFASLQGDPDAWPELEDHQRRVTMFCDLLHRISAGELMVKRRMMTDEAVFYLNGLGNTEHTSFYAGENSKQIHDRPVRDPNVMVCVRQDSEFAVGSFFLNSDVTEEEYRKMLR